MSVIPFTYADQPVRVVEIDGEPWFVGADIARILGIASASGITRMVDDEDKGSHELETPGGRQNLTIVNESGMYTALMRSNNPAAKPFRRWITSEVLPQIRKTGAYSATPELTEAQIVHQALAIVHRDLEAANARIAHLEPRARYVDAFVADDDLRILRNVAKSLGLKESALRRALLNHGWIYCEESSRWSEKRQEKVRQYRYSAYAEHRHYFRPVPNHEAPRFKGEVDHTLKVTPAGAAAIERAAIRWGLIPTTEMDAA